MRILEVEITDETHGRALVDRGQYGAKKWLSIRKNFTTNQWQLRNSRTYIHERVIELQTRKELREQFEKLSKLT